MKCQYEGVGCLNGRCVGTREIDPCIGYEKCATFKPYIMTNADRIRVMSDEELARMICDGISSDVCDYCEHGSAYCDAAPCKGVLERAIILEWLRRPAKGGDSNAD